MNSRRELAHGERRDLACRPRPSRRRAPPRRAVCSACVLPLRSSSCAARRVHARPACARIAAAQRQHLIGADHEGLRASSLTASRLGRASTSATSLRLERRSPLIAWRRRVSSRPGGSTMKASPAASSSLAADRLAEARISGGSPLQEAHAFMVEHRRLAVVIEADDRRAVSSIERRVTSMIGQPLPRAELPRLGDLRGDRLAVDIVSRCRCRMLDHAVLADLRDALGARHQPDDEGVGRAYRASAAAACRAPAARSRS